MSKATPVTHPKSFTEFVQEIETLRTSASSPLWYRGLSQPDHKLQPSLFRGSQNTSLSELADLARSLILRFKQRSIPYTREPTNDTHGWNTLFFMQHYGIPTRLLDWTENPFVALFFALMSHNIKKRRDGSINYTKDASVWVMNPVQWNRAALHHISFSDGILETSDEETAGYKPTLPLENMNRHPVALHGAHNSSRIVAQRGVFTIFGQDTTPMEQVHGTHSFPTECLREIRIDKEHLPSLRSALLAHGITESVVFPDLSGLANEIKREFGFGA